MTWNLPETKHDKYIFFFTSRFTAKNLDLYHQAFSIVRHQNQMEEERSVLVVKFLIKVHRTHHPRDAKIALEKGIELFMMTPSRHPHNIRRKLMIKSPQRRSQLF